MSEDRYVVYCLPGIHLLPEDIHKAPAVYTPNEQPVMPYTEPSQYIINHTGQSVTIAL